MTKKQQCQKVQRTMTWEQRNGTAEQAGRCDVATYDKAMATSKSAAHANVGVTDHSIGAGTMERERHVRQSTGNIKKGAGHDNG